MIQRINGNDTMRALLIALGGIGVGAGLLALGLMFDGLPGATLVILAFVTAVLGVGGSLASSKSLFVIIHAHRLNFLALFVKSQFSFGVFLSCFCVEIAPPVKHRVVIYL